MIELLSWELLILVYLYIMSLFVIRKKFTNFILMLKEISLSSINKWKQDLAVYGVDCFTTNFFKSMFSDNNWFFCSMVAIYIVEFDI